MRRLRKYTHQGNAFRPKASNPRKLETELIGQIRLRASKLELLTESRFKETVSELRTRMSQGLDPTGIETVVECFALVTSALRRVTGKIYYDCQLIGGLILATGTIAEMATGEGKTITTMLPAVLYGLTGNGVHVATTNSYLAERDYEELRPIFDEMGVSVGLNHSDLPLAQKIAAYKNDVTYATGYEFGFDFLRDQIALRRRSDYPLGTRFLGSLRGIDFHGVQLCQRKLAFAIIDEADSVLIDEATTPLVLSGQDNGSVTDPSVYVSAMRVAEQLDVKFDIEIDYAARTIKFQEPGWKSIHEKLPKSIAHRFQRPWSSYVEQALRAQYFLRCDVDYVNQDNKIVIVDQNTGRLHDERTWRNGLHQAVEVREHVELTPEKDVDARISRQRYFQFYDKVAGMTGTATGNERELGEFYKMAVVVVPRNKPSQLQPLPCRQFGSVAAKFWAIVTEVRNRVPTGQPVLIGTQSIQQSRLLSSMLIDARLKHALLNGTQDATEASIIAQAGKPGQITIATNMAGRGTDIKIATQSEKAGGLHVIATERSISRRVDRQLIGRSARQGQPGSYQFFVSAADDLISRHDSKLGAKMQNACDENGECVTSFENEIDRVQRRVETDDYLRRRKLVEHDQWLESIQETVAKLA